MKMSKVVNLTECTEFKLRANTLKVYPATLSQMIELAPKIEEVAKVKTELDQAKAYCDIIYDLIKDDNVGLDRDELFKVLTVRACMEILKVVSGTEDVVVPTV